MPWSLSVCSCNIAPPLLVFPWLEFPSQLPVAHMNAVREFAVFFQDPCDKISARAPRGRPEHLGQPAQALLFCATWNGGGGHAMGVGRRVPRRWERSGPVCPKVDVNSWHVYQGRASSQVWGTSGADGTMPTLMKSCISGDAKPFWVILIYGQEDCPVGCENLRLWGD